jgi:hypothetical protein
MTFWSNAKLPLEKWQLAGQFSAFIPWHLEGVQDLTVRFLPRNHAGFRTITLVGIPEAQ